VIALMIGHFLGGEIIGARAIAGSTLVLVSTVALMKDRRTVRSRVSPAKSQEFVSLET
jgi:hypothetical protein